MRSKSLLVFALGFAAILFIALVGSALWMPTSFFANTVTGGSKEGAKEAISLLKDSTVWMASLQTATIAALGLLSKDGALSTKLTTFQERLVILVALLNTAALFCSAWLLTALPSIMLRAYKDDLPNYDFFNFPLYAYMENIPGLRSLGLHYFAFWNHWLWGIGILFFGILSVSMLVRRAEA